MMPPTLASGVLHPGFVFKTMSNLDSVRPISSPYVCGRNAGASRFYGRRGPKGNKGLGPTYAGRDFRRSEICFTPGQQSQA